MKPWKVIAFHTDDDLYNGEIANLKESLRKFNIPNVIKTVKDLGDWRSNCMAMSGYILQALYDNKENLVFLDADAVVREYPVLFDTITEDFAVHYREDVELLAGTMYFKNCDKIKQFVRDWIDCSRKMPGRLASQTSIQFALNMGKYSVYKLPAPYTLIFDRMKKQGPPVIEHFQASRRARH
jgi:hypothetical protein